MSVEDRIFVLAQEIIGSQDADEAALLSEELLDAIQLRVIDLRHKLGRIPLAQFGAPKIAAS
jgi:hypothetical protein